MTFTTGSSIAKRSGRDQSTLNSRLRRAPGPPSDVQVGQWIVFAAEDTLALRHCAAAVSIVSTVPRWSRRSCQRLSSLPS